MPAASLERYIMCKYSEETGGSYNIFQFLLWFPWNALITSVMYDKALIIF